jgi:hypothetical protein
VAHAAIAVGVHVLALMLRAILEEGELNGDIQVTGADGEGDAVLDIGGEQVVPQRGGGHAKAYQQTTRDICGHGPSDCCAWVPD